MMRTILLISLLIFFLSACVTSNIKIPADTLTPSPTSSPMPTATIEALVEDDIKVNSSFPIYNTRRGETLYENYSSITLEQISNGDLLKAEEEYLKTHILFIKDRAIAANKLTKQSFSVKSTSNGWSMDIESLNIPSNEEYRSNRDSRPLKIFSYYPLVDFEIFKELGMEDFFIDNNRRTEETYLRDFTFYPAFWIVSWAYLNPDETTTIGHTLLDLPRLERSMERAAEDFPGLDYKFVPAYSHESFVPPNDEYETTYNGYLFTKMLFNKYPQFKPEETEIDSWASSGQMPKNLETKVFIFQGFLTVW